MSEFSVVLNDQDNFPIGLLNVFVFNHSYFVYENGKPVLEWNIRAFPMNYKWIKQFGNLENLLNRYINKEKIDSKLSPDVIIKPVDEKHAIELTSNFCGKLTNAASQWNELAVKWPSDFIPRTDNKMIYLNLVFQQYKNLHKSFQNRMHCRMDENPFLTIAWDTLLRNLLFDNHIDYYELFSKDNQSKTDELTGSNDPTKFLSFADIIQDKHLYDSQFHSKRKTINLNEIMHKIMCVYEVSEKQFSKEVNLDYSYQKELARYFFIPVDAERTNSGIYILMKGNETRHIYFCLESEMIEEFIENIKQTTGAIADEEDEEDDEML
jgi:hypothetical protein